MAVACIIAEPIKAVSIDPTHRFVMQACSFYLFLCGLRLRLGQTPRRGGAKVPW
jgi:hypothetical protein